MAQILEDAGLPEGVFHVLPGGPDVGQALVEHPLVKMISFTGSTAVGKKIGEICGRMLKKASLELGGNNAQVVLEDADLDIASSCGAWALFCIRGKSVCRPVDTSSKVRWQTFILLAWPLAPETLPAETLRKNRFI